MHRYRDPFRNAILIAVLVLTTGSITIPLKSANADSTTQALPFSQNWTDTGQITTNDDWSGVPGMIGYLGDDSSSTTAGLDPQTLLTGADGTGMYGASIDVIANQTAPNTLTTGGVAEFAITDPVIALQGSGTADAPHLVISINTVGYQNIQMSYNIRDIDGSTDNAAQQVALHYRVGSTGSFTNLPDGYIADATEGGTATTVTPVSVTLPTEAENQALVQLRIMTTNAAGSDEWIGIDDISITGEVYTGEAAPYVTATSPANGAIVATNTSLIVNFSEDVSLDTDWFSLSCDGAPLSAVTSGSGSTYTLSPTTDLPLGGSCTLTINAASVSDTDTIDPPDTMTSDSILNFSVTRCGLTFTLIHNIQGSSTTSSLAGTDVTVEGIVTANFSASGKLGGFYIQSPAGEMDADDSTSEGIFIYTGSSPSKTITVGDRVRLSGTVSEYNSGSSSYGTMYHMTEITSSLTDYEVCSTGNTIESTTLTLPLPESADPAAYLERYESMLVTISGSTGKNLFVQQNYYQARFGQLTIGVEGSYQRTFIPTNGNDTTDLSGVIRRLIILDDGSTFQNMSSVPYYDSSAPLRAGDQVGSLIGILDQGKINSTSSSSSSFTDTFPNIYYRLHPIQTPIFTSVNTRSANSTPPVVAGEITVSGFNVMNFFTTLDNGSLPGPYDSSNTPRGADTASEYNRQLEKLVTAISTLDADVVGLLEIESWNDANAVQTLVDAVNAKLGSTVYAAVAYPDTFPQPPDDADTIKVALIYNTTAVTPIGSAMIDLDSVFSRVPLAQEFRSNTDNEIFSVVVNHFKSKGSCPDAADDPTNVDLGQGCWTALRVQQAQQLLNFVDAIASDTGDPDVLVIGDLNSYGAEDPIVTLTTGGLVNQIAKYVSPADRYSYVYDGQAGYLDHSLATPNLDSQISGADFWHINADEPVFIDYDENYNPSGVFNGNIPFRASDHDPSITGLDLSSNPVQLTTDLNSIVPQNYTLTFTVNSSNPATGSAVPAALFQLEIENTTTAMVSAAAFYDETSQNWVNAPRSANGNGLIISVDPSNARLLAAGGTASLKFKITFTTSGEYNLIIRLLDQSREDVSAVAEITATTMEIGGDIVDTYNTYLPIISHP